MKGRTGDEAGRLSLGQIMKELMNFIKDFVINFVFYPEDNRVSLRRLKQGGNLTVLHFRNTTKASE